MHTHIYGWPLNNMGFNCSGPLICMFFFPDKYTFGSHPWVSNRGLNQPLVENSTLESWLGISGCRGLTVCMVLAIIHKGFEHSQILFCGHPGTNSLQILRVNCG